MNANIRIPTNITNNERTIKEIETWQNMKETQQTKQRTDTASTHKWTIIKDNPEYEEHDVKLKKQQTESNSNTITTNARYSRIHVFKLASTHINTWKDI